MYILNKTSIASVVTILVDLDELDRPGLLGHEVPKVVDINSSICRHVLENCLECEKMMCAQ